MAKIQFALSSQQMASGGGTNQRSAPGVQAPGQIKAPGFEAPQANAGLLPSNFESTPVLNPQVAQRGMSLMANAALDYRDRQDAYDAQEALLEAREYVRDSLYKVKDDGTGAVGFESLTGQQAIKQSPEYQKRVMDIFDSTASRLSGNARAKFLAAAQSHREAALDRIARHTVSAEGQRREDVQVKAWDAFSADLDQDPIGAMKNGGLQLLLTTQPDEKAKSKMIEKVYSFVADKFIAEDPNTGYQAAQGFLNTFGAQATADARLKVQEKIATAMKAARYIDRRDKQDRDIENQAAFITDIPPLIAQAMKDGAGDEISGAISFGQQFFKGKDNVEFMTKTAPPLITGVMWQQVRDPKNPTDVAAIRVNWTKLKDVAEAKGRPFDVLLDKSVMDGIEEMEKYQQEQRKKGEDDAVRYVAEHPVTSESGEAYHDPAVADRKGLKLPPMIRMELERQKNKIGKEIKDERTAEAYDAQYSARLGQAYAMQLAPGSDAERELNEAQLNPATRLKPEHYARIKELSRRDTTKDSTQLTAARKAIDGLAQNGYFEPGVATKTGKKPYKETQLTAATWSAYAQWMRRAEELITEGNKNVVGTIEAELAQSVKERTFFTGSPEKFGAPPVAPQAAPQQPKVTTPPPQAPLAPAEAAAPTPPQPQQEAPPPAPVNIKTFKPEFQRLDPAVQKALNEGAGMDIQIMLQNDAYSWSKFQSMTPQEQLSRIEKALGGGKK